MTTASAVSDDDVEEEGLLHYITHGTELRKRR